MLRRVFEKWIEKRERKVELGDGGDFIFISEFFVY